MIYNTYSLYDLLPKITKDTNNVYITWPMIGLHDMTSDERQHIIRQVRSVSNILPAQPIDFAYVAAIVETACDDNVDTLLKAHRVYTNG